MADANLAVTFTASVDGLASGISAAKDALSSLSGSVGEMNAQYADLGRSMAQAFAPDKLEGFGAALREQASLQNSLAAAHAQAAAAMRSGDEAAQKDALGAARLTIGEEIKLAQEGLKAKLSLLNEEVGRHEITQAQKAQAARKATDAEYQAEAGLLGQEAALGEASLTQKAQFDNKRIEAEQRYQREITNIVQKSIDAQQKEYEGFGNAISQAFNSQLHGLITGTTNWHTAFKNILADLLIKFIEWGETTVIHALANEAAKTAAAVGGVAARTSAEQAGSAATLASQGAAVIRSIMSSAAEAFAGVFGFLSPIMGPLAAGPAAAAQAVVEGAAGTVAVADIGMWQVPNDMLSLVHRNELIMPAAPAAAFRDMLTDGGSGKDSPAVHIHPTTNFHVSAVDSGSVAQWMKSNSPAMMKAMDEAVRHGAHLGLRRLAGW